jgi:hypothetical protein
MSSSQPQQTPWSRLSGMGVEYGAVVAAFTLLGWWVDRHWQVEGHLGMLIGAGLGLVGGTYNFVREALAAVRESERQERRPGSLPDAGQHEAGSPSAGSGPGELKDSDADRRR